MLRPFCKLITPHFRHGLLLVLAAAISFAAGFAALRIIAKPAPPDLPHIVAQWTPRVVRILCTTPAQYFTASGVLTRLSLPDRNLVGVPAIITNRHVIADPSNGAPYRNCVFQVTGTNDVYDLDMSRAIASSTADFAYLLAEPATSTPEGAKTGMRACPARAASLGDRVLILGYPTDGGTGQASTAITASEGIISSLDGPYYVTDAKIDGGNSGGAAILEKEDCYLGIPTGVQKGAFTSLARILNASLFLAAPRP